MVYQGLHYSGDLEMQNYHLEQPRYEQGKSTEKLIRYGYIAIWLVDVALLGIGGRALYVNFSNPPSPSQQEIPGLITNSTYLSLFLKFLFTLIMTASNETLGYIHSVALRWCLAKEKALKTNSPLRLFTRTRLTWTNGITGNCLWMVFLSIGYGAANTALTREVFDKNGNEIHYLKVNGISFAALGLALMGLCIISGIAWWTGKTSKRIKTWSPDPLNTTLACIENELLEPPSCAEKLVLREKQPSAWKVFKDMEINDIRNLIWTVGFMVLFFGVLSVVVVAALLIMKVKTIPIFSFFPELTFVYDKNNKHITSRLMFAPNLPKIPALFVPLIWSSCWQAISTMIFHAAELVVGIHRDEACWREAIKKKGAGLDRNPLTAALTSWTFLGLLVIKSFGQWVYGAGIFNTGFSPVPLVSFTCILGILLIFILGVARHRPSRSLPATYGRLEELSRLVDDWHTNPQSKIWWGCKDHIPGPHSNIQRVGTTKSWSKVSHGRDWISPKPGLSVTYSPTRGSWQTFRAVV